MPWCMQDVSLKSSDTERLMIVRSNFVHSKDIQYSLVVWYP